MVLRVLGASDASHVWYVNVSLQTFWLGKLLGTSLQNALPGIGTKPTWASAFNNVLVVLSTEICRTPMPFRASSQKALLMFWKLVLTYKPACVQERCTHQRTLSTGSNRSILAVGLHGTLVGETDGGCCVGADDGDLEVLVGGGPEGEEKLLALVAAAAGRRRRLH